MPFYDLHCEKCEGEFNISASIADKTNKRIPCPKCGSFALKTVYKGAPAYIKNAKAPECPNRHICGADCRHAN
ncbi:MAG: zinc ribbon domain-containing protein [Oscillospiraceae bacterium]|nr:zinc ribbon domain-containing protein [Oscillospiraceae bacterium]